MTIWDDGKPVHADIFPVLYNCKCQKLDNICGLVQLKKILRLMCDLDIVCKCYEVSFVDLVKIVI